jgi:hypothetical protein
LELPTARSAWDIPSSSTYLFLHATAFGLRRTSTPSPFRTSRIGFGFVKALAIRNKLISKLYQLFRERGLPYGLQDLCLRFACLVRLSLGSATDARLDTGGWLALTRQGLSPC